MRPFLDPIGPPRPLPPLKGHVAGWGTPAAIAGPSPRAGVSARVVAAAAGAPTWEPMSFPRRVPSTGPSTGPATARSTRILVGVAFAALLSGCSLFGSDERSATTTAPTTSTSTTTAPVSRTEPVELLEAGAEPRQALRVTYTEDDTATITFTSDFQVTQKTEGRTQHLNSPPIAQTLAYTVGAVTDEGAELTIRIDAVAAKGKGTGLNDKELAALNAELAPMVGLEATGTVSPLGELEGLAFELPDAVPEALATQLRALETQLPSIGPALPSEPVGVGATWRSTSTSSAGGAEVETVTTFTATEIDEHHVAYTATVASSAQPQDVALTGLAEGTSARLTSSDLSGTATGSLGLDEVMLTLRTRLRGVQELTLTSDAGPTDLAQELELATSASTAPG